MTLEEHRRLDATVAEKVMGWHPRNVGIREQLRFTPPDGESPTGAYPVDVGPGEEWSPSTDIAAAWEVVEKLDALGFLVSVDRLIGYNPTGRFWRAETYVEDKEEGGRTGDNWHDADTAPLAICLAALAALGVTVE